MRYIVRSGDISHDSDEYKSYLACQKCVCFQDHMSRISCGMIPKKKVIHHLVPAMKLECERFGTIQKQIVEKRLATAYLKLSKKEKIRGEEHARFKPGKLYWEGRVKSLLRSLAACDEVTNKAINIVLREFVTSQVIPRGTYGVDPVFGARFETYVPELTNYSEYAKLIAAF